MKSFKVTLTGNKFSVKRTLRANHVLEAIDLVMKEYGLQLEHIEEVTVEYGAA